ncbi:MAG TPA: SWIM zinc finger family protein [Methanoregula sp.]|nr:SWIM zinc finger family protein [Methanoregula sp.]
MSDLWQRLAEKKVLDASLRFEIEESFGTRGKKALIALDSGRIKKYLDFFVVQGRTAEYIVDDDFCTCSDFMFRGRTCWHLLAVRIAQETKTFRHIDSWYQDQWEK